MSGPIRGLNLEGEEDLLPELVVPRERVSLAQRRSLATPAALDTGAASGLAATPAAANRLSPTPANAAPVTPATPSSSTVRRRASLADPDSPIFLPHSPTAPSAQPLSPRTDAYIHLQQARASVALGQVGQGMHEQRRGSLFSALTGSGSNPAVGTVSGKRQSTAAYPPPAPSSSYRIGGNAPPSRTTRSGSAAATLSAPSSSPSDPLINLTPADVRRPSFLLTAATTASTIAASPKRYLLLPSRRMQKTFRLWGIAALALFAFIKLVDVLAPSIGKSYPSALRMVPGLGSSSYRLAHAGWHGALEQLPPSFTNLVDKLPRPSAWMEPVQLGAPVRVEVGDARPDEGAQVEAEQLAFEQQQQLPAAAGVLTPEEEERAKTELVLTEAEKEMVRRNRAEKLWAAPEEDLWVQTVRPAKNHLHESTIIFLHGLGEKAGDSFMPIYLHKKFPTVRWVLPQAPDRSVTAMQGNVHPAWFDIDAFPYDPADRDYDQLFSSVRAINRVISEERALLIRNLRRRGGGSTGPLSSGPNPGEGYATSLGPDGQDGEMDAFGTPEERAWASKRIVLAGFSQGSVVSMLAGLTNPEHLAGVVVFSGFLPLREDISKLMFDLDRKGLPMFWGHGTDDPYLLFTDALTSISLAQPAAVPTYDNPLAVPAPTYLQNPSYRLNLTDVTFKEYIGLGHSFTVDELMDASAFLERILPKGQQRGERMPRWVSTEPPVAPVAEAVPALAAPETVAVPEANVVPEAVAAAPVPPVGGGGMQRRRR
ncbi:hypothetical protein JCM10207_005174 [Rhodosporidiobolus poonsookiae]